MHYAIIAAGEGSRLAQEGIERPKPLVELDGRPMLRRLADIFASCGAESIAVIVNESMPEVREYAERMASELSVPVRIVVKSTPSSMHSFHEVSRAIPRGGKFIVTTVDTVFQEDEFLHYAKAFETDLEADGYMAVTDFIDDEKPLYIDTAPATMRIIGFRDMPSETDRYISGGIYGLSERALDVLDRCMATGVSRMRNYQRALVESGLNLQAWPFEKIIDVDHAADIVTAREFINS